MNLIFVEYLLINYKHFQFHLNHLLNQQLKLMEKKKCVKEMICFIEVFHYLIVVLMMELNILPFQGMLVNVEEEYVVEISFSIVYYVFCSPSSSEVTLRIHSIVRLLFLLSSWLMQIQERKRSRNETKRK